MAAPVVLPVKRRRTAPAAPAQCAVTDVANVAELGSLIKIYMVFFHPLRRVAVRGVEKLIVSVPWLQLHREVGSGESWICTSKTCFETNYFLRHKLIR
jgi:hypothetical protein